MEVQVSTRNNIRTIIGNGFALFLDSLTGKPMLKDSNGSVEFVENLINLSTNQDNIARQINVENQELSIYEGSLKSKMAQFISASNITKQPTDGEYFFNIVPDTVQLTAFLVASGESPDVCQAPVFNPKDTTLYHNGEGDFPVVGDTVFVDPEGVSPFSNTEGIVVQMDNGGYVVTNNQGIMTLYTCR